MAGRSQLPAPVIWASSRQQPSPTDQTSLSRGLGDALLILLARSKIDALLSFGNTVGDDQSSLRKAPI